MKALLIVDLQNDFLPGGALAVKKGDRIIHSIKRLMNLPFDLFVASKDWHPLNHCSFALTHGKVPQEHVFLEGEDQILWPVHCVQESIGAEFSSEVDFSQIDRVFAKGADPNIDSYSAFFDNGHLKATGLADYLKEKQISELWITGLTTEYCVKYSALDAVKLHLRVYVVRDACCAVNLNKGDEELAFEEMKQAGVEIVSLKEVEAYMLAST